MTVLLSDEDNDIQVTGVYSTSPVALTKYARSKNAYAHRIVMSRIVGRNLLTSERVDHINGNGLDCRRENLRFANSSQNAANRKRVRRGSSKYKGVTFDKSMGKWQARIMVMYKTKRLGYFDDERDAAMAYDVAAKEYFGEYAVTNLCES